MKGEIILILCCVNFTLCYLSCDKEIDIDDNGTVVLSSPGYYEGRNYDVNLRCKWNIRSEFAMLLNFTYFDIEYHYLCEWDYVMIYSGKCGTNTSSRYCGAVSPNISSWNETMCIEFVSDHVVTRSGFEVVIIQKDTMTALTSSSTSSAPIDVDSITSIGFKKTPSVNYIIKADSSNDNLPILSQSSDVSSKPIDILSVYPYDVLMTNVVNPKFTSSYTQAFDEINLHPSPSIEKQYSKRFRTSNPFISQDITSDFSFSYKSMKLVSAEFNPFHTSTFNSLTLSHFEPLISSDVNSHNSMAMLSSTQQTGHMATNVETNLSEGQIVQSSMHFEHTAARDYKRKNGDGRDTCSDVLNNQLVSEKRNEYPSLALTKDTHSSIDFSRLIYATPIASMESSMSLYPTLINSVSPTAIQLSHIGSPSYVQIQPTPSIGNALPFIQSLDSRTIHLDSSIQLNNENVSNTLSTVIYEEPISTLSLSSKHNYHNRTKPILSEHTESINQTSSMMFVATSKIEFSSSSTILIHTKPLACHVTDQIFVDKHGNMSIEVNSLGEDLVCSWLLLTNSEMTVEVSITNISIPSGNNCDIEGIFVFDGSSASGANILRLCKTYHPKTVTSTESAVYIMVKTKEKISFRIFYNEKNKENKCSGRDYDCLNGKCIPQEWLCDNEYDCASQEDEKSCGQCNKDEYRCGNGICIDAILKCNGRPECDDSSDENECVLLGDSGLRLRYGYSLLPVCGTHFSKVLGDLICEYLSLSQTSNFEIVPSIQLVHMSYTNQSLRNNNINIYNYLLPSTECNTLVQLTCQQKDCGMRSPSLVVPYIVDGKQSYVGQWPWMVAIWIDGHFACGGTLLSNIWVVTAGHCLQNVMSNPHMLSVVLGTSLKDGSGGVVMRVSEIVRHPMYDTIHRADIALLRFQRPIKFNDFVKPICLPNALQTLPRDTECHIAGWGSKTAKGDGVQHLSDNLMNAQVNLWTRSKCENAYPSRIDDTVICAGHMYGGADTCQGDSGGPLMCSRDQVTWELVGITSWGDTSCGAPKSPGVYTNVKSYLEWIKSVIVLELPVTSNVCSFEVPGLCQLEVIGKGNFVWTKRKAGWTVGGQPLVDNTYKTTNGHFLFADTYLISRIDFSNAVFQININKSTSDRCLRFWYIFQDTTDVKIKVIDVSNNTSKELWKVSSSSSDWQEAEIGISRQITGIHVVAYSNIKYFSGGIAIDDIILLNSRCSSLNLASCYFDNGHTCGYTNSHDELGYWIVEQSLTSSQKEWWSVFDGSIFPTHTKAKLISPVFNASGPRCFTFLFKLCAWNTNSLSVILGFIFNNVKHQGFELWAASSKDQLSCEVWSHESVDIPSMPINYFIIIQAERIDEPGKVYLDNVVFKDGNC